MRTYDIDVSSQCISPDQLGRRHSYLRNDANVCVRICRYHYRCINVGDLEFGEGQVECRQDEATYVKGKRAGVSEKREYRVVP